MKGTTQASHVWARPLPQVGMLLNQQQVLINMVAAMKGVPTAAAEGQAQAGAAASSAPDKPAGAAGISKPPAGAASMSKQTEGADGASKRTDGASKQTEGVWTADPSHTTVRAPAARVARVSAAFCP